MHSLQFPCPSPSFPGDHPHLATVGDFFYYRNVLLRILPYVTEVMTPPMPSFHLSGALQRIGLLSNKRIDVHPYADRYGNLKGWETPTLCSFLSSSSSCLSSSSSTVPPLLFLFILYLV